MNTLKDEIKLDFDATVFNTDEFAGSVTYTPAGGADKPISAQVLPSGADIDAFSGSDRWDEVCLITIPADATDGIATPAVGDTVTIDGFVWAVASIAELGEIAHKLRLGRRKRKRFGTPGSRLE